MNYKIYAIAKRYMPFVALVLFTIEFKNIEAVCSLEKMKSFAMEACEHLFQQDDVRDKRSVGYNSNSIIRFNHYKSHGKKHYISRSIYPTGGYLQVGTMHYNKLSQADVQPRYKLKKVHHEKKERFKREHLPVYNNIVYCCFNACRGDFFC